MKKFKFTALAIMMVAMMLSFNSCDKLDVPTEEGVVLFDAPEFLVPEVDNTAGEIIDGTLETPLALVPESADIRLYDGNGRDGDPGMREKRKFMPMARILRDLALDEAQIELIKAIMADHRLCVEEKVLVLREQEKALLAPFIEQRTAIKEAYKNGEMTREEAGLALKAINEQVREILAQTDYRVQACEAMKECRRIMLEAIRATLTPEQQVKWDAWYSTLPEVDCTRKTPPTREG